MPDPTLALAIPAYNAAWCLPRLLTSAAAQAVPFDEILVYDDQSSDDTAAVAEAHGARVVRGDVNVGCSAGKNRLAEKASSEWIHFHDADDELKPDFVERARVWMAQGEDAPDIVLFSYEERGGETGELLSIRTFDDAALREDAVAYTIREQINPFCGLYRRSAFLAAGGYDLDPAVLYNEDVAFHCRMARAGLRFAADPAVTVVNYRYGNSMSQANLDRCIRAHVAVLTKAARESDARYHPLIAEKLWAAAGVAGSYLVWDVADEAARQARALGSKAPQTGGRLFAWTARVSPRIALRAREHAIRRLRPHLRRDAKYHPSRS